MCREGAWAELTVEVTFVVGVRREAHGFKFARICIRRMEPGEQAAAHRCAGNRFGWGSF